jgi:hypothetical protein
MKTYKEKRSKSLRTTKTRVFALNGASQRRVTKEKNAIYNKIKLGFCVAKLARSALDHTHRALERMRVFKAPAVRT